MNFNSYENAIKFFLNENYKIDSDNFLEYKVNLYKKDHKIQISIYAIFENYFIKEDSDMSNYNRSKIQNDIKNIFPSLKNADIVYASTSKEFYESKHEPFYKNLKKNKLVKEILRKYNERNDSLLTEASKIKTLTDKIDYRKYESTIKQLINDSFPIDSENFDRFEVDIYPLSYILHCQISAIFKKSYDHRDIILSENLRHPIIDFLNSFFPPFKEFDWGYSLKTDEIYLEKYKPYYESLKGIEEIKEELRKYNSKNLLTEASKINALKGKLGFSQEVAEELDRLCGPLSVWMGNKLIDHVIANSKTGYSPDYDRKNAADYINQSGLGRFHNRINIGYIQGIMDYIRVGLDGNTSTIKNLNYEELKEKSKEWHDSLKVSGGEINYTEPHTHNILVDKRDKNGIGFYWVDLNTNSSDEECRRMGHCGRTNNANTILSLRETKPYQGNPKYTINTSHLTAAVGNNDGILYQLKGPKNSKPKEEYNDLILPLFYILGGGGEQEDYFIQGFGSEYASERDFKLTDLPDNVITTLYRDRPELFQSYSLRKKLRELGLVEVPEIDYVIEYEVRPDGVDSIVDGDWTVRQRKVKTPAGYERTEKIGMFETILSGDMWDMWDNYHAEWKSALDYNVDNKNEQKIWDLIKGMAGEEFDEHLSLKDAIEEYDGDHQIRSAISSSVNDAESSSYADYLYGNLKDALEEWGEVLKMDDTGVKLRINTEKYIQEYIDYQGDEEFEDAFERCNEDVSCVFNEILDTLDKPKFHYDDRWYPDINDVDFNDMLSDRLSEI